MKQSERVSVPARSKAKAGKREVEAERWRGALGATHSAKLANARLTLLSEALGTQIHLISPSTAVAALPAGTSLLLSKVPLQGSETYPVGGGRFALSKSALEKIAAAAGISWDPVLSRRLDEGLDPCVCGWQAVGQLRQLDGAEWAIVGSAELDLRDGSPTVEGLAARTKKSKDAAKQLREMRMFIVRHAESKARLRAIRSLGVRANYSREELERPFIVARLTWTGQSDDPLERRMFAEKIADHFLGARSALYRAAVGPVVAADGRGHQAAQDLLTESV